MGKIIHWLRSFTFWGFLFAMLFFFGFQVSVGQMLESVQSGDLICKILCIYMLASCVAFPVLVVVWLIQEKKMRVPFSDSLAWGIPPLLWPPYKALDIKNSLGSLKTYDSAAAKAYDIGVYIRRLFDLILWWAIVVIATLHMINGQDSLPVHVRSVRPLRLLVCIVILVLICVVLWLVGYLLTKAMMKRIRQEHVIRSKGTRAQQYFKRHPEQIPSGCAACGGPYPECRASCNAFDE